jgi:hypothetical protein
MSASSALDHEQILPKLIGKALHLEILRHAQYCIYIQLRTTKKQALTPMNGLEKEFPFCSNPDCVLYVRAGDPGVKGSGNWVELSDGRVVGRSIYSGVYLCDFCGSEWRPVPTFGLSNRDVSSET